MLDKMGATLKEQSQEKGRYKVIGSTKYHGNIMYDSTEGKYVDGNGKEVSQSIVNEAMNTGRSGSGSGTSPISGVPASISNLARTYALMLIKRQPVHILQRTHDSWRSTNGRGLMNKRLRKLKPLSIQLPLIHSLWLENDMCPNKLFQQDRRIKNH